MIFVQMLLSIIYQYNPDSAYKYNFIKKVFSKLLTSILSILVPATLSLSLITIYLPFILNISSW